jgi:hypothetical protein
MGWRCGSSSRVPALQRQSPEFKLQFHTHTHTHTHAHTTDTLMVYYTIFEKQEYNVYILNKPMFRENYITYMWMQCGY